MSQETTGGVTRRGVLAVGGAAVAAGALGAGCRRAVAAAAEPISIVINQSPWFDSFRQTVALYEKETGNKVDLDVNPFAGSLEKQRNSVRAAQGQYDLLVMNSGWFAEMYFGGFLEADLPISNRRSSSTRTSIRLNDTIYFDPVKKVMAPGGKLMSIPISPLIPLLYYRGDLYKDAGPDHGGHVRRAGSERPQAQQPAADLWHRAARCARHGVGVVRLLSVSLRVRWRHLQGSAAPPIIP